MDGSQPAQQCPSGAFQARSRPLLSVAPMMAWTDHHYRALARLLTKETLLYTEMLPAASILEAARYSSSSSCDSSSSFSRLQRTLQFDRQQHPIAVQVGGRDPGQVAAASAIAASFGYDEIDLNVGCPSDTVSVKNQYGACLMKEPATVQKVCAAMRTAIAGSSNSCAALSVKHRLGVDDYDSFEQLLEFVKIVSAAPAGITHFVVHARKAILGLSTSENRAVPPLRHDWVFKLARDFPQLTFELNGEVRSLELVKTLLEKAPNVVAVMVGRAAFRDSWALLSTADSRLFGKADLNLSRREVVCRYSEYAVQAWDKHSLAIEAEIKEQLRKQAGGGCVKPTAVNTRLKPHLRGLRLAILQPLYGLFPGNEDFANRLRRAVDKNMHVKKACAQAVKCVSNFDLDLLPSEMASSRKIFNGDESSK